MRAARWHGRGDVRVEEVPELGDPPPGWVRLRVEACGICGTDLEEYLAGPVVIPMSPHPLLGRSAPLTMGHEMAGVVEYVGAGVTSLAVGTRVAVENSVCCGECFWCRRDEVNLCRVMGNLGLHGDGGLADAVLVPAATCVPYAPSLSAAEAALSEPLAVAVRALRRSGLEPGERVAVVGAGTVGLLAVQAARALGAGDVVAVDTNDVRRDLAVQLRASAAFVPGEAVAGLEDLTDGVGADRVIEAAGNAAAVDLSVRLTRRGGRTVLLGVFPGEVSLDVVDLLMGEREVVGSISHRYDTDFPQAVELLGSGAVQAGPLITDRIPLDDVVTRGFDALRDEPAAHLKVIVEP